MNKVLVMDEPIAIERRLRTRTELKKLSIPVEEFVGVRCYSQNSGCTKSHQLMMKEAFRKKDHLLVFEDDVKITDAKLLGEQITEALADPTWDIYYLGFHPPSPKCEIVEELEKHYRVKGVIGTHAIIYRKKAMALVLGVLDVNGNLGDKVNIDVIIRDLFQEKCRCYCPKKLAVSIYKGESIRVFSKARTTSDSDMTESFNQMVERWNNGNR